jgi:pyruvate/2-oxoglutarate dehydrogenase complex dihydrolipoamide dehydrogenase (E3) component
MIGSGREPSALSLPPDVVSGVEHKFGEHVLGLNGSREVATKNGKRRFDSVVMATGCRAIDEVPTLWKKAGLHVLSSLEAFMNLREHLSEYERVAVGGNNMLALDISDRIALLGVKVMLFASNGGLSSRMSVAVRRFIDERIVAAGVEIVRSNPDNLAGIDKVEAVLVRGDVYPCQAYIVAPGCLPSVVGVGASLGRSGGIVVDADMKSSASSLFAAGGCAETRMGSTTFPIRTETSAIITGAVAGRNASGDSIRARVLGYTLKKIFGIDFSEAGLTRAEASQAGIEATEVSTSTEESACTLVFEKASLRVIGVQAAGVGVSRLAQSLPFLVMGELGIDELAYSDIESSTDISLVSETAREGLRGRVNSTW